MENQIKPQFSGKSALHLLPEIIPKSLIQLTSFSGKFRWNIRYNHDIHHSILTRCFSLLNGLAVSDTGIIQAKAEIVGYVSRVETISYTESVLLGKKQAYILSKVPKPCPSNTHSNSAKNPRRYSFQVTLSTSCLTGRPSSGWNQCLHSLSVHNSTDTRSCRRSFTGLANNSYFLS